MVFSEFFLSVHVSTQQRVMCQSQFFIQFGPNICYFCSI